MNLSRRSFLIGASVALVVPARFAVARTNMPWRRVFDFSFATNMSKLGDEPIYVEISRMGGPVLNNWGMLPGSGIQWMAADPQREMIFSPNGPMQVNVAGLEADMEAYMHTYFYVGGQRYRECLGWRDCKLVSTEVVKL